MDNLNKENIVDSKFRAENPPIWPYEFLVKLLSSSAYSEIKSKLLSKPKVLEVGNVAGNNARMLRQKNFQVYGSGVNSEIVGFFDSKKHLESRVKKFYSNVDVHSWSESFSTLNLARWIAIAQNEMARTEFSKETISSE